jgi:hypothetical protein
LRGLTDPLFFWLLVAGCHEQFSATYRSAQIFRRKFVHFDMLTFFPKSVIIITVRRGVRKMNELLEDIMTCGVLLVLLACVFITMLGV